MWNRGCVRTRVRNCDGTSYLSFARTRAHAQHHRVKDTHRHTAIIIKCWNETHESGAITSTRVVTHLDTQLSNSKLKQRRMHATFQMDTAFSAIVLYPSFCIHQTRTDVMLGGHQQTYRTRRSTAHTSWINRLPEMLHFYRINNIGHRDDDSFKMLDGSIHQPILLYRLIVWHGMECADSNAVNNKNNSNNATDWQLAPSIFYNQMYVIWFGLVALGFVSHRFDFASPSENSVKVIFSSNLRPPLSVSITVCLYLFLCMARIIIDSFVRISEQVNHLTEMSHNFFWFRGNF